MPHVAITRTFYDLKGESGRFGLSPEQRARMGGTASTWDTLLADRTEHLVLVSPSGSGKTSEMKRTAAALRAQGQQALYSNARHIASEGFLHSLEAAEAEAFEAWAASAYPATIFVDGVDELPLVSRDFASLARHVTRGLAGPTNGYRLVLSARTGAWAPAFESVLKAQTRDDRPFRQVGFERLTLAAIRSLAVGAGCTDVERFMESLAREELAELIEIRPCDVQPLVERWQRTGNIGRWSDVLSEFVDRALDQSTAERAQSLTPHDGRTAAQRLGAATVFCKTPFVSLPTIAATNGRVSGRALFEDWRWPQITELFETHLFVPKGDDAVQLFQGSLPSFLAGRWIMGRVAGGQTAHWVRELLLVRVHDRPEWHVPQSRRETLGWTLSQLPDLRRMLVATYPDLILFEGDPERLRDAEIVACLTRLIYSREESDHVRLPWPRDTYLRKLARPQLEPAIVPLLDSARRDASAEHVLRWCEIGRYSSALGRASELALESSTSPSVRCAAIRVVRECGGATAREALGSLVGVEDEDVRVELARCLIPGFIQGTDLARFILDGKGLSFAITIRKLASKMSTVDLTAMLSRAAGQDAPPDETALDETAPDDAPTTDDSWPTLVTGLVISYLAREDSDPATAARTLLSLERMDMRGGYVSSDDVREINRLLDASKDTRRALWSARLATDRWSRATFGCWSPDDVSWLLDKTLVPDAPWHPTIWVESILDRLRDSQPSRLDALKASDGRVRALVEEREHRAAEETRQQVARDAEQSRRRDSMRAKATARFSDRRDAIARGTDMTALREVYGGLRPQLLTRRSTSLGELESHLGPELASAFLSGFRASWRLVRPRPLQPNDSWVDTDASIGLVGLQLDFDAGLDARALSASEAETAARIAVHELNGFPNWFERLIEAHEPIVRGVVRDVVQAFWSAKDPSFGLLPRATHAEPLAAVLLRSIAVEQLTACLPDAPSQLHSAFDAVLLSATGTAPLLARITRYIAETSLDDARLPDLLRGWAHIAPMDAATWFEKQLPADRDRARDVFVTTVGMIEQDFDEQRSRVRSSALLAPAALERWAALLLAEVPMHEDPTHDDVYSPDARDHAGDFRNRCFAQLAKDPSFAAYTAISELQARRWSPNDALYLARVKEAHLAVAAEAAATAWKPADILGIERGDERPPANLEDLFRLVCRHLEDVAAILETSEFSYRKLITPTTLEREMQLWVAESLRQRAGHLYSVVRENVVAKDKEVDITAVADGVGQIPIEIKPLMRKYTQGYLEKVVSDQLVKQYMTQPDRRFGIVLLVHHIDKTWTIGAKKRQPVEALHAHLEAHARSIGARENRVVAVHLIRATAPSDA